MKRLSLLRVRQKLRDAGVSPDRLWRRVLDAAVEAGRGNTEEQPTPTLHELEYAWRMLSETGSNPDRLWERVFRKVLELKVEKLGQEMPWEVSDPLARFVKESDFSEFPSSSTETEPELVTSYVNAKTKMDLPVQQRGKRKTETNPARQCES